MLVKLSSIIFFLIHAGIHEQEQHTNERALLRNRLWLPLTNALMVSSTEPLKRHSLRHAEETKTSTRFKSRTRFRQLRVRARGRHVKRKNFYWGNFQVARDRNSGSALRETALSRHRGAPSIKNIFPSVPFKLLVRFVRAATKEFFYRTHYRGTIAARESSPAKAGENAIQLILINDP